jgi:drug/metabolite transporter (DMT)-like permease
MSSKRITIALALLSLYLIWGGAYYVIRIGVDSWPPLLLAALRFGLAGALMFAWARWRGEAMPGWREWRNAALIGILMIAFGNGCINLAETRVSTGVTALVQATDPLFIALFARLFGVRTGWRQWLAILLGFAGILVLNQGSSLSGSPLSALFLMLANAAWGLGSVLSQRLSQARGTMGSAAMMLAGGIELLLCSALSGERMQTLPPLSGWLALLYLTVFASIIAFTAYLYLLERVSTTLATSYAYINPVVAECLGMWLLAEQVGRSEWLGMGIILAAVLLIVLPTGKTASDSPTATLAETREIS